MADELKVIVSADASRLTTEMTKATASLQKFEKGSGQATQAMTNLGRVVQDAPYGFIGVANNINPLLESFQRLKVETGSTGGALKALGSSLIGAGGLGFAVSLASTALIVFGDRLFGSSKKAKEAEDAVDKYKNAIDGVYESTAKEATQVSSLIAVLSSEVDTRQRKLAALEELKKINPDIFEGLVLEGNAVRGLDAAYQAYIANLKNVVAAKIIQAQLDAKLTELIKEQGIAQTKSQRDLGNAIKGINSAQANALRNLGDQGARAADQIQSIGEFQDKVKSDKIANLNLEIQDLVKQLSEFSKSIKVDLPTKKLEKEVPDQLEKVIKKVAPLKKEFDTAVLDIFSIPSLNLGKPPTAEIERFAKDFSAEINQFLQNSAIDIGIAFGTTLGQAIAGTATIGDFFKNIFAVVGQGLQQLGASLLTAAIAIKGIKEFLVKNPVAAIAGSIALIAIGTLIKSATSKNAFATGTNFAPGGLSLVGERGPELINLPRGSRVTPAAQTAASLSGGLNDIRVYGVMRGRDIYFTNQRYGQTFNTTT